MKKLILLATFFITLSSFAQIKTIPASLALESKQGWGESPIWDIKNQRLFWTDMTDKSFHIFTPGTNQDTLIQLPMIPGTIILTENGNRVVIPMGDGIYAYDLEEKKLEKIADNPNVFNGKANRFNDGDCDPSGRLWVGTENRNYSAKFYRVTPDYVLTEMFDSVRVSNGVAFSPDEKLMYYIDTETMNLDMFDFDNEKGEISNRRTLVKFDRENMGMPDGMTVDTNGTLWVCGLQKDKGVLGFDPLTGKQLYKIEVPERNCLACAFGGENLDMLYITTDKGLYVANTGVKGFAPNLFKGK